MVLVAVPHRRLALGPEVARLRREGPVAHRVRGDELGVVALDRDLLDVGLDELLVGL
jgi:hypothetical protein